MYYLLASVSIWTCATHKCFSRQQHLDEIGKAHLDKADEMGSVVQTMGWRIFEIYRGGDMVTVVSV